MARQPTDDSEAIPSAGRGHDSPRARKRPRGFYARLARARGVSPGAVYRKLNPDKRPCAREKHECDTRPPWDARELVRMDRAFCEAMLREIARGTERPRGPAITPAAARALRPRRPSRRRSRAPSTPRARAAAGECDRLC
jgi:hypothetical protein